MALLTRKRLTSWYSCRNLDVLCSMTFPRRTTRIRVDKCMATLGFGPAARRWVSSCMTGCRVRSKELLSFSFPVGSCLAQGSQLSSLLYVVAAKPLAAHLRKLDPEISRPSAFLTAPPLSPCYQHADDTSVHLRTLADVSTALQGDSWQGSIQLFFAVSTAKVNPHRTQDLVLGPGDFSGVMTASGIPCGRGPLFATSASASASILRALLSKHRRSYSDLNPQHSQALNFSAAHTAGEGARCQASASLKADTPCHLRPTASAPAGGRN